MVTLITRYVGDKNTTVDSALMYGTFVPWTALLKHTINPSVRKNCNNSSPVNRFQLVLCTDLSTMYLVTEHLSKGLDV